MANLRFNPVVSTKLPAILSHRRSTIVSLETYPFIHLKYQLNFSSCINKNVISIIASLLRDENVIALVEGSEDKISTCALSTVTGIPLIRLHDSKVSDQCEKVIQMSAGYKDIATATLALINMFHWESIAVLFDGKQNFCRSR